jgi:hypothetical protein
MKDDGACCGFNIVNKFLKTIKILWVDQRAGVRAKVPSEAEFIGGSAIAF